jgi:sugar O-acyltransferase (sialic acid O-acetyltransferase NeuD family)
VSARPLVIFGAGDFARCAAHYFTVDSPHEVVAFTVHEPHLPSPARCGDIDVVAFERLVQTHPPAEYAMFVAIGYSGVNATRAGIVEQCRALGYELVSYLNSRATRWEDVPLGANTFVFENNVIQPFVTIGDDVILWSGNHIGHDVTIGDHVFVASHAVISGNVTIGAYSFIGVNATIRDGITIAPRCLIGAGAVIMRDTEEGDVFAVPNTRLFPKRSWELDGF